ncbi:MAG TPA: HEAT repeat domain-containing protein [Pyrinomonadaceae bacterium]
MPRSLPTNYRWRALAAWLAFAVFVSLMLVEAGAQGRRGRSQPQQNTASGTNPQQNRKSIASVRNVDTRDGSRVTITSDVPLNDYAAYWNGDRYYVVIPEAELITRDAQSLQNSLRGAGYQDVLIEKKGNDVVISFRIQPGMRARVEQKFNRLDVIFTAPPGVVFSPNTNRNTGRPTTTGGGTGNTSSTGNTGGQGNTSGGGTSTTGGSTGGSTSGGGGTATASTGGGGTRRGRSRGGSRGGYSGGGGDRGGGAPLNIPLPDDTQPAATPSPGTSATTTATPSASPSVGEGTAQTNTNTPLASTSPTPEQIARTDTQSPVTAPPVTTSTETTAPAPATTSNTGFAAVVQENWLPLLIGLLVLIAIGLLLASRSRADRSEARETEQLQDKKQEPIKAKPASRTGAAIAGAAAGAATAAAVTKEPPAKTTPAKEPAKAEDVKGIEPVAPTIGMEHIGAEVKNLLEGKDYDKAVIGSMNPETRQIVSTEILAALASRNPERQQRARQAFTQHGFFDEATQRLRTADAPAERISAARALGLTQDHTATPHLVAALEDDDAEVRRASVNALAELRDPSAIGPLNALLEREKNRKVPHSLIRRAIEASATIDVAQTPATETPDATATNADKKDKDDDDREVFEI